MPLPVPGQVASSCSRGEAAFRGRFVGSVHRSSGKGSGQAPFYTELTGRTRSWLTPGDARSADLWAGETPDRQEAQVRVLVVEDVRPLAQAIAEGLRREAIAADVVFDGGSARERLALNDYDLGILDRDLPIVPGDEIFRSLVSGEAPVPIPIPTAARDLAHPGAGLRPAADDAPP